MEEIMKASGNNLGTNIGGEAWEEKVKDRCP